MVFARNSLVLQILSFWYGFTVSDPFPLRLLALREMEKHPYGPVDFMFCIIKSVGIKHLSRSMTKPTPAQSDQSSLWAPLVAKDPVLVHGCPG